MNPLLQVNRITVEFLTGASRNPARQETGKITAVDDVSFSLGEGETLGIVGESGSGKTTLARTIVGTIPTREGEILWNGTDLTRMSSSARQKVRREISMIFQNPLASLNPCMTIGQIVAEPLGIHEPGITGTAIGTKVAEAMERVGLNPGLRNRYPHEFSGGQCQRVGIARAIITRPRLIICDEPVASLDMSIRAQIVNLLKQLQNEHGISLIMISHDVGVIRHVSHRVMVMYLGNVVEVIPSRDLLERSCHPYTRTLINSIPIPDPLLQRERNRRMPSMTSHPAGHPSSGCRYTDRCPIAQPGCTSSRPILDKIGTDHMLACPHTTMPAEGPD